MDISKDVQSMGGLARRDSLTPDERSDIARRAALARFNPQATHEGEFRLADRTIRAAVLPSGKRLIVQGNFLRAIGRSRTPKAGTGVLTTEKTGELPFFLQAALLQKYVGDDLRQLAKPVHFLSRGGEKTVGYEAELLPAAAEVYLRLRDDLLDQKKPIPANYAHIIKSCDALTRGLARVGIVALVDEATGYQDERVRDALQKILDKYLGVTFGAWAKRFPDEFYFEMFRLRSWKLSGHRMPPLVGKLTNNLVYERLAPGLLAKLKDLNPVDDKGRRRHKHHQWMTADVGHPELDKHLHTVVSFMRASPTWDEFIHLLNRALPRKGQTLELQLS